MIREYNHLLLLTGKIIVDNERVREYVGPTLVAITIVINTL